MKHIGVILAFCIISPFVCSAATIYVDDTLGDDSYAGTSDYPKKSISGGISVAANDDTVLVRDGNYTGSNNRNLNCSGKAITLISENGPDYCTIDAGDVTRVFNMTSESEDLVIDGFTITGGYNDESLGTGGGGGIYISSGDCTIRNCIITQNHADYLGGGLLINSCNPTIENCTIEDNATSKTTILNTGGGGVYLYSCPADGPLLDNCTIQNNTSVQHGGGIYCNNSYIRIEGSHIIGNQATNTSYSCYGGGIYTTQPVPGVTMTITDTNIIDNFADTGGAGVSVEYSEVSLTNVLFEHNVVASGAGGGLRMADTNSTIENCTFVYNAASATGGAIGMFRARPGTPLTTARNSIIVDNTSGNNTQVIPSINTAFEYAYCNVDPATISGYGSTITDLGGNINVFPLFASVGYDNGGQWVVGDYHLQSRVGRWDNSLQDWVTTDTADSLCIDAANPNDSYDLEPLYNGNRRNMGRYGQTAQASQSPTCTGELAGDLTGDCRVDFADFAKMASHWLDCKIEPSEYCW